MEESSDELLKALVSDTRRDIVKTLSNGERTPSDLSKMLKKSKSTIVEHLQKLMDAGLVEKMERPGHKWVFYSLTRRGESYVSKNSKKIIIILSSVFIGIFGGFLSLVQHLNSDPKQFIYVERDVIAAAQSTSTPWFLYLSILLFSLSLIGIFVLILTRRRRMFEI